MGVWDLPFKGMHVGGKKMDDLRCLLQANVTNSGESLITSNVVIGNGDLSLRSQARAKLYFKSIKL